ATGFGITEGPVWRGEDLVFTDIPRSRIVRWRWLPEGPEVTTLQTSTGRSNGLALDRQGRLIRCEEGDRRLSRTELDGTTNVRAYDVRPDGSLVNSRLFADMASPEVGSPDGMKVDRHGNLYCTGGGGVRVVAPDGYRLGRIRLPEHSRNIAFGDADRRTLYI